MSAVHSFPKQISTKINVIPWLTFKHTYEGIAILYINHYTTPSGCVDTAVWMHYLDANKTPGEEARRQLHKNVESNIEQVHKAPAIWLPTSHHESYQS